jgi:hypothetical protein
VASQDCDIRPDLEYLHLETLADEVTLYFSEGHQEHAESVFGDFKAFASVIGDSLELFADEPLALLDPYDWERFAERVNNKYADLHMQPGFARYACHLAIAGTPDISPLLYGYLLDGFLSAPEAARSRFSAIAAQKGYGVNEAIAKVKDFMWAWAWSYHQLFGYLEYPPPPYYEPFWLVELVANFYDYAAIAELAPDLKDVYRALHDTLLEGFQDPAPYRADPWPARDLYLRHPSGEDPMPLPQTGWYESWISIRAAEMYETYGFQFVRDLVPLTPLVDDFEAYLHAVDQIAPGTWSWATPVERADDVPTKSYHLDQNFPNPFASTTTIGFELPEATQVSLGIYDVLGRKVLTLLDDRLQAGPHKIDFKAGPLPDGLYVYRIETPRMTSVRSMVLHR